MDDAPYQRPSRAAEAVQRLIEQRNAGMPPAAFQMSTALLRYWTTKILRRYDLLEDKRHEVGR